MTSEPSFINHWFKTVDLKLSWSRSRSRVTEELSGKTFSDRVPSCKRLEDNLVRLDRVG